MKLSFILPLLAIACLSLHAQQTMPRITNVEPGNGKVGDILTVSGENLDKAQVAELYLTDGKKDAKVEVTEQTPTSIKFKIPVAQRITQITDPLSRPGVPAIRCRRPAADSSSYRVPVDCCRRLSAIACRWSRSRVR
jgi:hypothetical protein